MVKELHLFPMGVNFLSISVVCTFVSFIGLQCWMGKSLEKYRIDGLIFEDFINSGNAILVLDLLLGSYITLALVASFALNVVIMVILCLKVSVSYIVWLHFKHILVKFFFLLSISMIGMKVYSSVLATNQLHDGVVLVLCLFST